MKKLLKTVPYLAVITAAFYLLPLLMRGTGSAILILLAALPLTCLAVSAVYGALNSFNPFYAPIVALLFIPAVFIYYNSSAWIYCPAYGAIALTGNLIGMTIYKTMHKG